jgi:hypothetical protein
LFDATVVLLQSIVEVLIAAMGDRVAECLAQSTRVGVMSIGRDLLWGMTNGSNRLPEKAPGRLYVSLLAQHGVHQVAISINVAIEVAPFPMHFDIGFIHVPGSPCLSIPLSTQLIRYQRNKTRFPVSHCLMCKDPTTLQEHFRKTHANSAYSAAAREQQVGRCRWGIPKS